MDNTIKITIINELANIENEVMLQKIYELVHIMNGYPEYVRKGAVAK